MANCVVLNPHADKQQQEREEKAEVDDGQFTAEGHGSKLQACG